MNKTLRLYAIKMILKGLNKLPDSYIHKFKQMYSHKNINLNIINVVNKMPDDKLDWALQQAETSIERYEDQTTPQQKIINFMLAKQKWLQNTTNRKIQYINNKDIDDIYKWDTDTCSTLITNLLSIVKLSLNSASCPFCIYYNDNCTQCTYGKHHGICRNNNNNPWNKYLHLLYEFENNDNIPIKLLDVLKF